MSFSLVIPNCEYFGICKSTDFIENNILPYAEKVGYFNFKNDLL